MDNIKKNVWYAPLRGMLLLLLPEAALSFAFNCSTVDKHSGHPQVMYLSIFFIAYTALSVAVMIWAFIRRHPSQAFRFFFLAWALSNIALSLYVGGDLTEADQMLYALGYLSFIRAGYFTALFTLAALWHRRMALDERADRNSAFPPEIQR